MLIFCSSPKVAKFAASEGMKCAEFIFEGCSSASLKMNSAHFIPSEKYMDDKSDYQMSGTL